MRWIIALAGGMAAAFAGTVAGGLVRPEVGSLAGQVASPRLETVSAGRRAAAPVEEVAPTALGEEVPDYVVGTDWLPPPFDEEAMQAEETEVDPMTVVSAAGPAPAPRARASQPLKTAPAGPVAEAAPAPPAAPLY